MRDSIVRDVLQLYRACRTDSGATPALVLATDPPAVTWQGLLFYTSKVDLLRAEEIKRLRKDSDGPR